MAERTNLPRSPSLRRLLMTRHTTIPPEMSWLHFSWSSVHGNAQIGFNQSVTYQVSWEFVNLRGKACGWVPVWEFGVVGGHWQGYLESCLLSSRRCGLIIREGECLEEEEEGGWWFTNRSLQKILGEATWSKGTTVMIAFIRSLEILGPSGPRLLFLGALRATDNDAETPSSNIVPRTIIFTQPYIAGSPYLRA